MTILESGITNLIKLDAAKKGIHLWRNNVGATYTDKGNFLRYGLANDSAKLNKHLKSADLIGIRPVIITPEMVGKIIGQFVSREVKQPDWRYANTEREQAQLRWANLIRSIGGDACFATDVNTF